mgnify:CR=1 FL=1
MSRNAALAATVSLTLLALAAPALGQTAPAPRAPADAATRAGYDRADALSRSVFWTQEQQLNPMDPVAGVKLSQALRELGQFDQAAETAQGVLVVQPANVEAMLEVGRAHIARGQAFYGIAALEQAKASLAERQASVAQLRREIGRDRSLQDLVAAEDAEVRRAKLQQRMLDTTYAEAGGDVSTAATQAAPGGLDEPAVDPDAARLVRLLVTAPALAVTASLSWSSDLMSSAMFRRSGCSWGSSL